MQDDCGITFFTEVLIGRAFVIEAVTTFADIVAKTGNVIAPIYEWNRFLDFKCCRALVFLLCHIA